jgi:hypothetical protein
MAYSVYVPPAAPVDDKITVTQVNHGLEPGSIIRLTAANTYVKALADSAANAEVVGYVTVSGGSDTFKYAANGYVTAGVPAATAGSVMFLSPTVSGALTATEPNTVGQISKPLMVVLESAQKGLFINLRGLEVSSDEGLPAGLVPINVTGSNGGDTSILESAAWKILHLNNTGAQVLTIHPDSSYSVAHQNGTIVYWTTIASGQWTFSPSSTGITLESRGNALKTATTALYEKAAAGALYKRSSNVWQLWGDTTST